MSQGARIAGAILAGGQSRRMGQNKALLTLAGTTLLQRAIDRLRPQVTALILNVHDEATATGIRGVPVVPDADGDRQGPLAGILASLRWAEAAGIARIATAAVDTPFFPKDLVEHLAAAAGDRTMAVASSGGRLHPVFGLWSSGLASELEREIGKGLSSPRQWAALNHAGIADWSDEPYDPFFNVNQPDDVTRAAAILHEFSP